MNRWPVTPTGRPLMHGNVANAGAFDGLAADGGAAAEGGTATGAAAVLAAAALLIGSRVLGIMFGAGPEKGAFEALKFGWDSGVASPPPPPPVVVLALELKLSKNRRRDTLARWDNFWR